MEFKEANPSSNVLPSGIQTRPSQIPVIYFVWRPSGISLPVIEMAQGTGSRVIFDFSTMEAEALGSYLQTADATGQVSDIKISTAALMNPSLGGILKKTGVRNLWVECHPRFFPGDTSALLQRLRSLSEDYHCFPIVGDVPLLTALAKEDSGIGRVVIKGCEAAGFVSCETTLGLYAAVKEMLRTSAKTLEIIIWGGVSTPEAAAAFLSTGAAGIVFESIHWLTDLVVMDAQQRQQIARLRLDSTALVGLELQVPCRLFNKGNSQAFKKIRAFEDSLCAAEITDENCRAFNGEVQAKTIHPLDSHFTPNEIIPLGVESASASAFAERFGTETGPAIKAFLAEIKKLWVAAAAKQNCFLDSSLAREMGIKYPFIQGAMSWISDVPAFAAAIADAGGLPAIALGQMDAQTCDRKLGRLAEIMGQRPYALNVVSLAENPFREMQLNWIKQHRPRFVWIAGGDVSPIRELLQCGIAVVYIAPDDALLKLALEAGVRYVVCEGYEAGGHVGQHSTLTLAQMILDFKRRQPTLSGDCKFILAGGIYNRETAFIASLLGADGIQMGTAYLATREAVESGALTPLYQRVLVESPPGGTVISGQSTGLRVRSLRTPRMAAVLALEREFAAGHQDEQTFRKNIEEMTAGSLFTAVRGVDRKSGLPMSEQACMERGQFMTGSCAGLISKIQSVELFHQELAEGSLLLQQPTATTIETPVSKVIHKMNGAAHQRENHDRVVISGMSVLNSLGKSPEEVWAASLAMKSGVTLVPSSKWDNNLFFDLRPRVTDKTYCQVGAFVDFQASRTDLGIPPQDFRTMTAATRNTMWLAQKAIQDSGILESGIPRERIGVLISQNSGEAAGTLTGLIIRAYVNDILTDIKRAMSLTPEQERAIVREVKSRRMAPDDTTLLGRLNCTAAGFICNRYGFMGPSYAVSAACSTSLVALHSALQMIRNGIIDAAIVGGCEDDLTHLHFLEFSAVGALYGLSGRPLPPREASRPFDAERDGMVLGEGGGMIVIERESVARARGAQIHAVVTNMGASNNHLGMVESSSVTQEIAIRSSFQNLPYGPEAVDLVECHATSTRQGDVQEVHALKAVYTGSKRTVLTSFKSQIGHTLGASGVNNIIRGVMAMKAGVLPPTLNYKTPDPEIALEESGFLVASEPLDWKSWDHQPKRFQVNAFGFGGSNYVVQIEQALDGEDTILVSPGTETRLTVETTDALAEIQGVSFFRTEIGGRNCRLAVVAPSDKEAITVIERSAALAETAAASPKTARSLAQQGVFISPEDLRVAPLALVFPGQGAHYAGMGKNLYETFPVIKQWMDRAAAAADFDLLHLLFHDREENLQKTRWQQPALFTVEYAMAQYLISLGICPVALAGHSLGELTALCLAGVYSLEDGFRIVNQRAICMDKAATRHGDPGVMAATDAPLELLNEMIIRDWKDVHIGNINSPTQVILSGNTEPVKKLGAILKQKGYRFTLLRVSMAFHSPIMKIIRDELETFVASITFHSPKIPVISNTTMAAYPSEPAEIRRILMAHLESPVHWMNNVQTLWNDHGIRHFVEVGPGDILSGLIADTFPEPLCLQTCLPDAESRTYQTALAQLYVHGHLKAQSEPPFITLSNSQKIPASRPPLNHPPVAPDKPAVPVPAEAPVRQDHLESVIHIIMEATGFNRDEIQPDMDLRRDLSVRSSRLPIIMDAAERQFEITIELEEFIHVRTVREIAQQISAIVARQNGVSELPAAQVSESGAASVRLSESSVPERQDHLEAVIHIIMEATGFNRDEIQPDMDLRRDLSVRSSRLPIIMDAAERQFEITIELEEFIHVRTVREIAQKISAIVARQKGVGEQLAADVAPTGIPKPSVDEAPLKRLVFNLAPVEPTASVPMELSAGEMVLIVAPDQNDALAKSVGALLHQDYGVETIPLPFTAALEKIPGITSLAGLVITLPQAKSEPLAGMADVSRLLTGFFQLLKEFLKSPAKKFVVLLHCREDADTAGSLLTEGLLGLFLSAAQEYPAVQFRTLEIGRDTDLRQAWRAALDKGCAVVEMIHREGKALTSQAQLAPAIFDNSPSLKLNPGDVVVMSGGATGISAHLARSLAPFAPRLVFLGRTRLDSSAAEKSPAREIAQTLADLRALGMEATYQTCDVTDADAVRVALSAVTQRYGRIDGIIHGAGFLRDGFLDQMTLEDFSLVANVKFLGAWNLFSAAEESGLRFFVGLSSVAAIQGNPGQTNYAAANRMMSALLRSLRRKHGGIRFKALMLPPIEGAGMAEAPEVRDMLKRRGVGYVHVNELAGLFCRELFFAPADNDWVMFMKTLPSVKTAPLGEISPRATNGKLDVGTVALSPQDFPMIDGVTAVDLQREHLAATKIFSQQNDLWIADHRPVKSIAHPLVSATMMIETFMESARLLFPHLQVRGVRQVRFIDMISCPPEIFRSSKISCQRVAADHPEVVCETSLSVQEILSTVQLAERFIPHCTGQVLLGGGLGELAEWFQDFPVRPDELQTPPVNHDQILKWYEDRTGLTGRYRVLEVIEGAGQSVIRGQTIYRETADFAHLHGAHYQYSPYLLEALMQLTAFHVVTMNLQDRRSLVPTEVGEMRFLRQCRPDEKITMEARLRVQDKESVVWDVCGLDEQGRPIMQVRALRLHRVSP